jgi:hypothetical protein
VPEGSGGKADELEGTVTELVGGRGVEVGVGVGVGVVVGSGAASPHLPKSG